MYSMIFFLTKDTNVGGGPMEVLKDRYTITELSERLNVTDHALRYYEKELNLPVPKDERGRRYYTPELANIFYQIKTMRDEGLEIRAIRKILASENIIPEPPPVVVESDEKSLVTVKKDAIDPKKLFDELEQQLSACISREVSSAMEQFSKELMKTKLEIGACIENSVRKMESRMEKHFAEVDRLLGDWRERRKDRKLGKFFGIFK